MKKQIVWTRTFSSSVLAAVATLAVSPAVAASVVTIKPGAGHPNLSVSVSGTGFGFNEAVDVYVDTVDTLLLVTSATGTLTGSVTIPAAAQPGPHYVTAIGRHSGDAAQAAFTVTTPWTELGFGAAHLGWNPYENTLTAGNVASLGALWQIAANGLGAAPTVAANRVFVGTNAGLEAVSTATGSVLWKALPGSSFYASPAIAGLTLYVGDGSNAAMYALNAVTGATLWSQATGGAFESSPVVVGTSVYAGGVDGKVYAFAAATGKILWSYTTGGFIDSSPAIVNGVLYIGSTDKTLYALNAATGTLMWSYQTGGQVESSPAVSHGVVYVGSDDNKVYAISAAGQSPGSVLWSYTTGASVYSSPAVAYGLIYIGSADGTVYALDAHSGALRWSVPTGGVVEDPIVANGVVYVTSRSDTLFAIAATYGQVLATSVTGFSFLGSPTVSDGALYLNTFGGSTYAFALLADTNAARTHAGPPAPSSLRPDRSLVARP